MSAGNPAKLNLTVAIPTIVGRENLFDALKSFLCAQIIRDKLEGKIELIHLRDNKELSIGAKRQKLYEMAQGKFCVQIDDDDTVHPEYLRIINEVIENNSHVQGIGYLEHCDISGKITYAHHSGRWPEWGDDGIMDGKRFDHVRPLFFKDPILTEICRAVAVRDMRYGEDLDFATRLRASGRLKVCFDIDLPMYFYRYRDEPLETKYGFDR